MAVGRRSLGQGWEPCPFVSLRILFTADGKMISAGMPAPFRYQVNPAKAEYEGGIARNPELNEMEIMLVMMEESQRVWPRAPIAYGVQLKGDHFSMKVAGYTPARYKKLK